MVDFLPDLVEATVQMTAGLHVVYREDLPSGEPVDQALRDGFGAESGDEVVEVRPAQAGAISSRRWRVT
jgi:hypothetical protein